MSQLTPFFDPSGVAIIGASADPRKLSHGVLRNCLSYGFAGAVYPVNPRAQEILGLPCYPDIEAVPDPVELAVLMTPAATCPSVLEACGRRGLRAAIVISGGFREVGAEGLALEQELLRIAAQHDMRLIGPNCVGTLDAHTGLNTTFIRTMPKPGPIAFVSQSGAICGGILEWTAGKGIGFSRFATLGNATDVTETDLLLDLAEDPNTRVIVAYIEAIRDGRRFIDVARQITPHKPILVVKAGRTQAGTRAVSSHTGSLAGALAAYDAAFQQAGVIRVDTVEDLFDHALALAYGPLPAGPRVAMVTNAGGPASLAADVVEQVGLTMPPTPEATLAALAGFTHPEAQLANPVDMLGGAEPAQYEQAVAALLASDAYDAVLPILVPQALVDPLAVAEAIARAAAGGSTSGDPTDARGLSGGLRAAESHEDEESQRIETQGSRYAAPSGGYSTSGKPVVVCLMGDEIVRQPMAVLHQHQIASYIFPEQAARALGTLWRYAEVQGRLRNQEIGNLGSDHRSPFTVHHLALGATHRHRQHLHRRSGAGGGLAQQGCQRLGLALAHAELGQARQLQAGQVAGLDHSGRANAHLHRLDILHAGHAGDSRLQVLGHQPAVQRPAVAVRPARRQRGEIFLQPGAHLLDHHIAEVALAHAQADGQVDIHVDRPPHVDLGGDQPPRVQVIADGLQEKPIGLGPARPHHIVSGHGQQGDDARVGAAAAGMKQGQHLDAAHVYAGRAHGHILEILGGHQPVAMAQVQGDVALPLLGAFALVAAPGGHRVLDLEAALQPWVGRGVDRADRHVASHAAAILVAGADALARGRPRAAQPVTEADLARLRIQHENPVVVVRGQQVVGQPPQLPAPLLVLRLQPQRVDDHRRAGQFSRLVRLAVAAA